MADEPRPSLLVIAYACSPKRGSEYGAGWGVVTALHEIADLTVLTGDRYIDEIWEWERDHVDETLEFVEVPDAQIGKFMRWHRIPEFLLYLLWQRKARRIGNDIVASGKIDAACHATFATSWLPTAATNLGIPSVWGPVGGGVTTPRQLWGLLGPAGVLQELLDLVAVRTMALLPTTRRSAIRATERLLQNEESRRLLPAAARGNSRILNHALFSVVPTPPPEADGRYALWVSPMESRKGPRLVIEALARTNSDVSLQMVGDGPQRKSLEELASRLGVSDRVTFTGWIDRKDAVRLMRGATTVIFTGLREEGGLALAEALYTARRVIVLDNGGAGAIARSATDQERVILVPPGDLNAVASGFAAAIDAHYEAGPVDDLPLLDRETAVTELRDAVSTALERWLV
jgi:glycosyltransferase involved in cell wall biosynthesis